MNNNLMTIRVWGDFACFTRPEMKVERVSYPLITPSAARGIFEAIFWEPQIYYLIDSIHVIQRGQWLSIRRNEVSSVISMTNAKQWMKGSKEFAPIQAGGGAKDGTQRNMLALQNVEYLISAEVRVSNIGKQAHVELKKYQAEIKRRAKMGKCFYRPYLGVREFAADFELEEDIEAVLERRTKELNQPNHWEENLGLMLYDVFDYKQRQQGFSWLSEEALLTKKKKDPRWQGELVKPQASFFHAQVESSKLDCHPQRVRFAQPQVLGG